MTMLVWQKSSDWKIFQNFCTSIYVSVVDVLLSYIDKNYTKFANLAEATKSCISYL